MIAYDGHKYYMNKETLDMIKKVFGKKEYDKPKLTKEKELFLSRMSREDYKKFIFFLGFQQLLIKFSTP